MTAKDKIQAWIRQDISTLHKASSIEEKLEILSSIQYWMNKLNRRV